MGDCAEDTGCSVNHDGSTTYLFCEAASTNWPNAKLHCEDNGYHLVVINNAAEQALIQALASTHGSNQWWIGLSDANGNRAYQNTEWVQGSPAYRNWEVGEPDRMAGCVLLSSNEDGVWDDRQCVSTESFICESP